MLSHTTTGALPHDWRGSTARSGGAQRLEYSGLTPTLSEEFDLDIHELKRREMTINEIARRTDPSSSPSPAIPTSSATTPPHPTGIVA
ncbi:hypothetical protein E3O65_09005 [Cryobacterium breve]|uniref:Uncharacterized protein n=1 Tax=Cryobacterium breve TaxID=1259258 RepID=A0ABY2IZA9_9MICO|nr:hypothetical protein E3O65_09005 [Cryobacterium breve]